MDASRNPATVLRELLGDNPCVDPERLAEAEAIFNEELQPAPWSQLVITYKQPDEVQAGSHVSMDGRIWRVRHRSDSVDAKFNQFTHLTLSPYEPFPYAGARGEAYINERGRIAIRPVREREN